MSFGDRLKEERKRLDKTQEQLAQQGNVTVQSYRKYESDKLMPSSKFLELIAGSGADIQFLVTGHRSVNREVIYNEPTDALVHILQLQDEFGTFNAEQIKALIGHAWHNQAGIDDLREFIKSALIVAGASEG